MQVDLPYLCDLRGVASTGQEPANLGEPTGFSIGAIVQLAVGHDHFSDWARTRVRRWAGSCPVLQAAISTYRSGTCAIQGDMWAARNLDFYPIIGRTWREHDHFHPFESRFTKTAKQAGFGTQAEALAGALLEMADNVTQHSGTDSHSPAPGLIGYHISDGHLAFAICDSGNGALHSLTQNPEWSHLTTAKDALMAIVQNHASRRCHMGDGEGFKTVFQSIAGINGLIDIQSNEGKVTITGTPEGRLAVPGFVGYLPGFQLSIACCLSGIAVEREIYIDHLT